MGFQTDLCGLESPSKTVLRDLDFTFRLGIGVDGDEFEGCLE